MDEEKEVRAEYKLVVKVVLGERFRKEYVTARVRDIVADGDFSVFEGAPEKPVDVSVVLQR